MTEKHLVKFCKPGKPGRCRYLLFSDHRQDYECGKRTEFKLALDILPLLAKGDNCPGVGKKIKEVVR